MVKGAQILDWKWYIKPFLFGFLLFGTWLVPFSLVMFMSFPMFTRHTSGELGYTISGAIGTAALFGIFLTLPPALWFAQKSGEEELSSVDA